MHFMFLTDKPRRLSVKFSLLTAGCLFLVQFFVMDF